MKNLNNFLNCLFIRCAVLLLVSLPCAFASYLKIDDLSDCPSIACNMQVFWKTNQMLIEEIKSDNGLTEEGKKHLLSNTNSVVQGIIKDYKRNQEQFLAELENSFLYVKTHKAEIKNDFGSVTYNNLFGGLKMLKKLSIQFLK